MGAVLETAEGMARLGLITQRDLNDLALPGLTAVPPYSAEQIQALRLRLKLSQPVFAALLNTSPSTVKKWEIGEKRPSGPSLKLLHLLDRKGLEALL